MNEDTLLVDCADGVATVTINRPRQRNAILRSMWVRMPEIFESLQEDGRSRVIVLRGAGEEAFASGQDINEFRDFQTPAVAEEHSALSEKALRRIEKIRIPIIAMVHGFGMGGAMGLLAGCDLRYAAEDAVIGVPAARLGIVYPEVLTRWIMNVVGPANAMEMLLTGRRYTAEEARHMGFFNRVLPKAELASFTYGVAREIAGNAPLSVRKGKEMIRLIQSASLLAEEKMAVARQLRHAGYASRDFQEGVEAFLRKRKPVFKGL